MIFDSIIEIFLGFGSMLYRLLGQYVFNYVVNLGRGFEQVFVVVAVAIFLLITVFLLVKRLKKLPKYYVVQIVDNSGKKIMLENLRVTFNTYDVATSYSQFYEALYNGQYRFRVTQFRRIVGDEPNTRGETTRVKY